jgi:hypothetical protein
VLSATRECCHYLQNSQGNGAAVLRQICANFQVRRFELIFIVYYHLDHSWQQRNYYYYLSSGNSRCGGHPLWVSVHILREQPQRLGSQSLLEAITLYFDGILRTQWNVHRQERACLGGNHYDTLAWNAVKCLTVFHCFKLLVSWLGAVNIEASNDGGNVPWANSRRTTLWPMSLPVSAPLSSIAFYGELGQVGECVAECCHSTRGI